MIDINELRSTEEEISYFGKYNIFEVFNKLPDNEVREILFNLFGGSRPFSRIHNDWNFTDETCTVKREIVNSRLLTLEIVSKSKWEFIRCTSAGINLIDDTKVIASIPICVFSVILEKILKLEAD